MSYNNIGLSTPRGSGTNGYIQTNRSNLKPRDPNRDRGLRLAAKGELDTEDDIKRDARRRETAKEIKDHESAREIEVKCMELRVMLEDEDVAEEDIEKRVEDLRKTLLERKNRSGSSRSRPESRDQSSRDRPSRDRVYRRDFRDKRSAPAPY